MQVTHPQALIGKNALVTGGTSGIGRAAALLFQAAGARVTLTGAHPERTASARRELPEAIEVLQADARQAEDAERLARHLGHSYGALDVVFLNAGIAQIAPFDAAPEAHYAEQMDVNVRGALLTLQKLLPLLRPGASVIVNTSVAAQLGVAGLAMYSATKGALGAAVRSLAVELAPRQIRVNAVSPGVIRTSIQAKFGLPADVQSAVDQKFLARIPLGRFGEPEEVARLALFLASGASSYMTGVEINVDGGLAISA
jgi:NAD(P)-dependent dehydrogenase (short-subunit alcohol dehydrogenase family)